MRTTKIILTVMLLSIVFSCKKEVKTINSQNAATQTSSEDEATSLCGNGKWTGAYGAPGYTDYPVDASTFISDGIARLTNSPWPDYYYSGIKLKIPSCRQISADSVKMDVRLKNPSTGIGAFNYNDVILWMFGKQDTARAISVGSDPEYCQLGLNSLLYSNIPAMLYTYEDWATVSLEAKSKHLITRRDGTIIKQVSYKGYKLGILKEINISFKGSGSVDWVKLYSTNSGKLLMSEDFNIDGKSSVVWY